METKHDRRCGHQLRARGLACIAEEPCVVEEDDDGKHEDPEEYGGQHTILRFSWDRGDRSAEGAREREEIAARARIESIPE